MPKGVPNDGRRNHHSWSGGLRSIRNADEILLLPGQYRDDMRLWVRKNVIIDEETGCWIWQKKLDKKGYPNINLKGTSCQGARIIYVLYQLEPLGPLFALHECDNPPCMNPDHIWAGTHDDNMKDAVDKGRFSNNGKQLFGKNHPRYIHGMYSKYA